MKMISQTKTLWTSLQSLHVAEAAGSLKMKSLPQDFNFKSSWEKSKLFSGEAKQTWEVVLVAGCY